ncbi:MAG: hypothetical protein GVY32_02860 [Gammaproteobacteria bacterium]|jgi:ABC-type transport system substrate-binding protein|nr:hypothetical protein [Gammaproteobacteria bacterium]
MPPARLPWLLALTLLLAACQQSEPEPLKVYRHAIDGIPASLDPAHADDVYAATLVTNLYDTLYRYKYLARPYELTPSLADGFPEVSEDGLTYRIRLRDDARFADDEAFPGGVGRPVRATDVVYSLKRHFLPDTRSRGDWLWRDRIVGLDEGTRLSDPDAPVEGLQVEDPLTVKIRLRRPYPQFTHTLAMALSAIVAREAVEHYGRSFGVNPVGSGPFVLARFDESRAVLEPNEHFRRGVIDLDAEGYDPARHDRFGLARIDGLTFPLLDRLEVHFIPEPTTRWTSFTASSGVDVVMVPPELSERVLAERDPIRLRPEIASRYRSWHGPEAGFVFHGFNMDNPEIGHHPDPGRAARNRALRCALRDAFDWQARNRAFYHGLGQIFPGAIPPILPAYDPDADADSISHSPRRARARLAEAGWQTDNLPRLVYGLESSVHQRQMFEQFRAWAQAIGFPASRLEARAYASFGEYARALGTRQVDLFLLGWTLAYPDAQYSLQLFYGPNAAPGANSFNYANPTFDQLFEQASSLPAGPRRTRLYRQLNRIVIEDCVIIGSLARTRLFLWKPHVLMLPDRDMVGGHFLRFVDIADQGG